MPHNWKNYSFVCNSLPPLAPGPNYPYLQVVPTWQDAFPCLASGVQSYPCSPTSEN